MWYNTNGDTMSELLAPAGSFEALVAAISNGADAVYLGMNQFGARAYAANFDVETLKQAIRYAHLRNVKIYVTMNTIVFEEELSSMRQMVQTLYEVGVDALIVQNPYAMGYLGVEKAWEILSRRGVEGDKLDTETTLVTRENMFLDEYQKILFLFD